MFTSWKGSQIDDKPQTGTARFFSEILYFTKSLVKHLLQISIPTQLELMSHHLLLFHRQREILIKNYITNSIVWNIWIISKTTKKFYDKIGTMLLSRLIDFHRCFYRYGRNRKSLWFFWYINIYTFFLRGHGNESCNLIGSLPGQYFPISAHGPR